MPRGSLLNEHEKGQIDAFNREGLSNREIGRKIGRSRSAVDHYLNNPEAYGVRKSSGRPAKLSERAQRHIANLASNSTKSCAAIRRELGLNVSRSTVWRSLSRNQHMVRSKMAKAPTLKAHHRVSRLDFAQKNMARDWSEVRK